MTSCLSDTVSETIDTKTPESKGKSTATLYYPHESIHQLSRYDPKVVSSATLASLEDSRSDRDDDSTDRDDGRVGAALGLLFIVL